MSTRTGRAWHPRRVAVAVVAACLLGLLAGGLWLAYRGSVAVREVAAGRDELTQAEQAYGRRDLAAGASHLSAARTHLSAAHHATDDRVWAVAATAPFVGRDVAAVRAVTGSAAGLLDALEPVAAGASAAGPDGLVSVLADGSAADDLRSAQRRAAASDALLAALAAGGLHGPVDDRVEVYRAQLGQVMPLLAGAADAAELAPRLVGPDQAAPLLVAVQTPAEVRSRGGLVGLVLVVRVEDGRLQVVDSYSGSTVPQTREPVLTDPRLAAQYALFGDRAGRYLVNATMLPDAADASALLAEHHRLRSGAAPAGVVITDLTVLSRLLEVTGPVPLPDGRVLDSATSDALLQNGIYLSEPDPLAQDAFFAATARSVVDAVAGPGGDPVALARVLAQESQEGRLSLWSPDAASQQLVERLGLDGDLLADPASVGVLLNDATGAKMQWYLRPTVSAGPGAAGGSTVRLELESTAPATGLPSYVTGGHEALGLPPGGQRVQVCVLGPVGGGPARWRVDGVELPAGSGVVDGRGAGVLGVDVVPGQRVVVEVDLSGPPDLAVGDLVLTPGVRRADG